MKIYRLLRLKNSQVFTFQNFWAPKNWGHLVNKCLPCLRFKAALMLWTVYIQKHMNIYAKDTRVCVYVYFAKSKTKLIYANL